ncbi:MAG: glycogen synthase [bacterium]|nr:glycogen synthase [bacterium]
MRVLMVSVEIAPFAKVGGLGDVVTALSRELARRGHDVRVVLPLYGHLDRKALGIRPVKSLPPLSVRVEGRVHDIRFHALARGARGVKIHLVESDLFAGEDIYLDGEDASKTLARTALHTQAALMLPRLLDWPVDIIHAHDATTVPALVYRRQWWAGREMPGIGATVLTIHNLAHQEVHASGDAAVLELPASLASYPGLLEFGGKLNLLKGGIAAADAVNTVSPTYARETVEDAEIGCGLSGVLAGRGEAYRGILNGADYGTWDPRRDRCLAATYSVRKMAGKAACRAALCDELGLDVAPNRPLCGLVGRLVEQKGVDLVTPLLDRLAGDGFGFVVLGTGEERFMAALRDAAGRHPDKVAAITAFDEDLAHRIYAGSDLFLMPSRFEPCGLSQMYALRYGTPPVVRRTGGLADTVIDATDAAGTGFVFESARPDELLAALRRAEALMADTKAWTALQRRGMGCAWDWSVAAAGYEDLYASALAATGS